jgi:predicted GTPase
MQRKRLIALAILIAAPIVTLIGLGIYHLWWTGWGFWLWWPLAACFALAYFLAWRWQKKQRLLRVDLNPPLHWTERDRQAWGVVEARAKQIPQVKVDKLTDLNYYVQTAQEMALDLARFYHPKAEDPLSFLTLPEILGVVELAAHDLSQMVDQYLPGGHLLTLNDLRRLKQWADWYPTISNATWLISSVFAPFNTALRFLAVQAGMNKPWQLLQDNILIWFFTAYVHRLGTYLIELNSGRLRVGAERFRQLQQSHLGAPAATRAGEADPADAVRTVTFILVGQAKAGKSSLINALLGEQRAFVDVLPATEGIERHVLHPAGVPSRFQILDTVGYGHGGPREDQRQTTAEAARASDLILLVLHARNPARQADLNLLQGLKDYFAARPELHKPPILAVLTHIDLLSPSLEWDPPYNWQQPRRVKEQQIDQAVAAVREQLGDFLVGVVPMCTAAGKVYGVQEWLLPALTELLDQAHAVAFLRCLKAEADTGKVRKVFDQLLGAARGLVKILWSGTSFQPPPGHGTAAR